MQYFAIAVVSIMVAFGLIAIVDTVFLKDRMGLGKEFRKAFVLIGQLVLAMTGILCFVPVFSFIIGKTLTPLYEAMHLDPSMAVASILAVDMGGYQLAVDVAIDPLIGQWAGMVYSSMMGATMVFLIPVGLAAIRHEDITHFSKGVLFGVSAIPVGAFFGGLMMGIKVTTLLLNLIIPIIFSIVIMLCITLLPKATVKVFKWFSIFIDAFAICALGIAIFKDFVLVPISDMGAFDIDSVPFFNMLAPTSEGILISGNIGLILSGTLPFVYVLTRLLTKPLGKVARRFDMTEIGITSLLTTTANSMAMFPCMERMHDREKVINVAFAVCASWVIGDHLAYAATKEATLIAPMMVAKLISGIIAIVIAVLFTRDMKSDTQPILSENIDSSAIDDVINKNIVDDTMCDTNINEK